MFTQSYLNPSYLTVHLTVSLIPLKKDTAMVTRNRQLNRLTPLFVLNVKYDDPENPRDGVKAQNAHQDGAGMYLQVMANESKYWRMDYTRPNKKRNTLALGVYEKTTREISLSNARKKRDDARALLKDGIDPADDRDQKKYDLVNKHANTFAVVADEVLALRKLAGKNDHEFNRRLNVNILPYIGKKPVSHLSTIMLDREIFARIYERGAIPLAKKIKGDIKRVLERARKNGLIPANPAIDIELPDRVEGNYPALIEPIDIAKLLKDMWSYDQRRAVAVATTPALKLSIMMFLRPGEMRKLKWSSYNRDDKTILIQTLKRDAKPAKKNGFQPLENHYVPLSRQAIEVLEELHEFTGRSEYVFFSPRGGEPYISEGTVNGALGRLGYKGEQTAHGLRATARTILEERLGIPVEWIEHQLGHTIKDVNGKAYNRTTNIDPRTVMMQIWSDYLDELRTGEYVEQNANKTRLYWQEKLKMSIIESL
jgi:integrase